MKNKSKERLVEGMEREREGERENIEGGRERKIEDLRDSKQRGWQKIVSASFLLLLVLILRV